MHSLTIGKSRFTYASLVVVLALSFAISCAVSAQEKKITFDDHVKPIFQKRCATCHNGGKKSGGLDLTNFTNLMQGGGSGQSVEQGDSGSSYLYLLVAHEESPAMPPGGNKIPDAEIKMIESWINAGALENSGSVAKIKKKVASGATVNIGVRPESVAYPLRMSLQPHFQPEQSGVVTATAISPWQAVTAVAAAKQVLLYDNRSLAFLGALAIPDGRANILQFSRNGQLLLAAGGRHGLVGKVFLWDVASTELVATVGEETDTILAADISANHGQVALGGPQKMLRVYSTDTSELNYEIKKHTDWVTSISFSPDGVLLASADRNGGVHVWEAQSGNEYLSLAGHGKAVTDLAWRGDANVLASCSDDGTIKLWEMERGRQIKSWSAHGAGVNSSDFNRDGQLVSVGREPIAKLWKQDAKNVRQFKGLGEFGVCCNFCDESKRLVVTDFAGKVRIFDATDSKELGTLPTTPKSLTEQLESSQARLAKLIEESKPLQENLTSIGDRVQTLQEKRTAVISKREQAKQLLNTMQTSLADTGQQLQNNIDSRDRWGHELEASQESLPDVAQAADSATEAAEKLPGDGELKELADKLRLKLDAIDARTLALENQITQSLANDEELKSKLSGTESEIEKGNNSLAGLNANIQSLSGKLEPQVSERDKVAEEVATFAKRIAKWQQRVQFWQAEIEFDSLLKKRMEALQTAKTKADERESELAAAKSALQDAQTKHDAQMSERDRSLENVEKHELELKKLRSRK